MALVVKDRVKVTTTTVGTGTLTLGAAATGYQAFSVIGNANTTYYTITDATTGAWEVGLGTYTSAGTTLSRDTVLASSNAGSLVTFAAGTKDVFCVYPAGRAVYYDTATNVTIATTLTSTSLVATANVTGSVVIASNGLVVNSNTVTTNYSIPSGSSATSAGPMTVNSGVSVTVPSGSRWVVL